MSVPRKLENPFANLLYGILFILFGLFALLLALTMWRSIENWLLLATTLASFAVPAFAAFFLGVRRLVQFVKCYSSAR